MAMDNANSTFDKSEFDWDAINVGDYQLDHSQNFFAARANKENNRGLSNVNPLQLCPTPQKICREQRDGDFGGKLVCAEDLIKESPKYVIEAPKDALTIEPKVEPQDMPKVEPEAELPVEYDPEPQDDVKPIVPLNWGTNGDDDEKHMTEADQHLIHQDARHPAVGGKLRLEWSPLSHREHEVAGASAASATTTAPKAYQFKDVYESKRQQLMRRRSEEESKARQFHSRPMPNFRAMHKRMGELAVIHKITIPRTPETLKHSQMNAERRREDDQERLHPAGTRSKPFHLRSEQRVRDRREFDAAVQASLEQKKKEQDEQRKRCEQEEIKELRKMTAFKARPNPFK
ncbi:stress response protein NST1 isoform X1 [Drosophila santomea]|uniref:stress response protein NST1 isoform X1 n=1 Tax=Drosophila santomea TaxID=129105 RepID=UPI001953FAA6|nr:stress response protein NST1 isoform X1 [Drosophila santomea]